MNAEARGSLTVSLLGTLFDRRITPLRKCPMPWERPRPREGKHDAEGDCSLVRTGSCRPGSANCSAAKAPHSFDPRPREGATYPSVPMMVRHRSSESLVSH